MRGSKGVGAPHRLVKRVRREWGRTGGRKAMRRRKTQPAAVGGRAEVWGGGRPVGGIEGHDPSKNLGP